MMVLSWMRREYHDMDRRMLSTNRLTHRRTPGGHLARLVVIQFHPKPSFSRRGARPEEREIERERLAQRPNLVLQDCLPPGLGS